jgi:hypothetical protein
MAFISHYHIIIRGIKDSLFIKVKGYILLFLLFRMLQSSIVNKITGRPRVLLRRLMSLVSE